MAKKKKELTAGNLSKPSGLNEDGTPNKHWLNFIKRTERYNELPIYRWGFDQVLGYLIKRYTQYMDRPFRFSYSGAPSKSKEMFCVKRMSLNLCTENSEILKEYIDWIFDRDIIPNNRQIKTLAYFFTPGLCDKFIEYRKKSQTITRTTPLPPKFIEEANTLGLKLNTYGDLAFAKMAVESAPEDYEEYNDYFNRIRNLGFNDNLIKDIPA